MRASHSRPVIANRKIPEAFTLRRATRYGGFNALSDFVRAVGIDAALSVAFADDKAAWATDPLPDTLRHLLDGYLLGVERVWHFADLEQEPLLCAKRDRERLPDYTLLYRDLARFEAPGRLGRLRAVSEELLRRALAKQPWYTGQLIRTAGQWVLKLATDWTGQVDVLCVREHLATLGP